jgi:hypothetical protein
MSDRPCFVGEVRLDGGPWQEVCRARTLEACLQLLFAYKPPTNVIAVERRVVPLDQAGTEGYALRIHPHSPHGTLHGQGGLSKPCHLRLSG